MKHFFTILGCLLLALAGGAEEPEFYVGVCTHFAQNKGTPSQNLEMAARAGIVSIRDEVYWQRVERQKGKLVIPDYFGKYLDEAVKRGIRPLIILDYGNRFYDGGNYPASDEAIEGFTRYCEAIVRYAGDRVKLYQVWNEWDGGCGMRGFGRGTPEGYVKLLRAVYPRLKKIAPDAIIISNSVCTGEKFLENTFRLGVLDYCDAIGFHTYNYTALLDTPVEAWFKRMQNLRKLIHSYNGGKDKPVFITEMGYPNHLSNSGSSEEESAIKLARLYLYARTLPFLKGLYWYDFQDDGWNSAHNENNFGLVRADLTPKLPYFAMKSLAARLSRAELLESETRDGLLLLRFRNGKEQFLAAINQKPGVDLQLIFTDTGSSRDALTLELVGSAPLTRSWGFRDWTARKAEVIPNQLSVTVGEMPLLLSGNVEKVRLTEVRPHAFDRTRLVKTAGLRLPAAFAEVLPAGETAQTMPFGTYRQLTDSRYGGLNDLSAGFRANYTRDALLLELEVKDNVFHQPETAIETAWKGDSIQLAFQCIGAPFSVRTEIDAALIGGKPAVMVRAAQGDRSRVPQCRIERRGERTVVYHLTIPARLFGLKAFDSGAMLTGALLVNDNDGNGRKGFLSWGGGIGIRKDPGLYNLFIFK